MKTINNISPRSAGHTLQYGDRIQVQLVRVQAGRRVIADFVLTTVNDLCEIYGELRYHTRGISGLTTLYVRNITRGWSFSRPFMLYADTMRPAASVSHPLVQLPRVGRSTSAPAKVRREIPESIRLLFGEH